jgi:cell division transport system permease protein
LLILALVVITVVVGMKITLFKSEIEVLRLLGGSGSYIKMPFLFEGMSYGFLGSFLGGGIILSLILFFKNNLLTFLSHISVPTPDFNLFFLIVGGQIVFGTLIGFLAAFLAVRKHLK